jgi:glycosyltransferase involved in cell wall biosynthesis
MNIGIEAQRILRRKKHGMEVVALELIRNLQQIDLKNNYTVFARYGQDENAITPSSNFEIDKFSSITYVDWEQVRLPARIGSKKIDLLHCTSNTAPLAVSIPLILTLHDIIFIEGTNFKGSAYQNMGNLYRKYIVPKIVKKADIIVTVSEFERENIIDRLKVSESKVKVIYNGVNSNFCTVFTEQQIEEFRAKYNLPNQYIMFLGNTAPKKNTYNVIRAYIEYCLSEKEPLPIVLLDYKRKFVLNILGELGQNTLINKFIFFNYIPHQEIAFFYRGAKLFLYPSLRESFGLPILEAMACRTPVITSNTSSMPEIAGNAAELVNPFDYMEISDAIKKLVEDTSLREHYINRGLQRVKAFTWKHTAQNLCDIYNSFK